jgi:hypothetical protein
MAARTAAKAKPRPKRAQGSTLWLQGLACGALLAFAPSFAALGAALLAPALVAALADSRPGRPVARAVFLASAAFTLMPAWHLFENGQNLATALDLLSEPAVIGPAWLAGACGWALCEVLPVLLRAVADARTAAHAHALRAEEKALREAWDLS